MAQRRVSTCFELLRTVSCADARPRRRCFDFRSATSPRLVFYTAVADAKMLLHLPWFQQQYGYEAKFDVSRCGHLESDRCA